MPVNRYYRGSEYRPELYAPPVQFIGAALEQAQKQYDTNFAAAQGMKNKYIQARQQDRSRANELQSQFESRIDQVASKYNGDFSQAGKDLYKLQADMAKLYGPGGEAGAIQNNFALEHNQNTILNFSVNLKQAVNNFDIENMDTYIQKFRKFFDEIQKVEV